MALLALNQDDPLFGANMALAAGLLQGNFGAGLQGFSQALNEGKDRQNKGLLQSMQMKNYESEIEARKLASLKDARQQKMIESFFPSMFGATPQSAAPAMPQSAYAPPGDGVGPTLPMPAPSASPASQGGGNDILALSEKFGIPPQAIQADMAFNGGKKISEMMAKYGAPDMQVTNGFAYDKNKLGAGFMPFLNTSQTGQTSMGRIDPRTGLPVVSAPQGALETYRSYRNADEGIKADFDPVTVTPQGQNPQMTTRGALVRSPQVQGAPGMLQAGEGERVQILQSELSRAQQQYTQAIRSGDQSAAARAQGDIAAIQREMGGKRPTVGMPLQSDEEKLRATKGVEADAARNTAQSASAEKSRDMTNYLTRARTLLEMGPTESGVGAAVDKTLGFFGGSTASSNLASSLDAVSGWLTANVPRMEGPQSNFDVQNYQTMAGKVGDRTLPIKDRLAAVAEIEALQKKYAGINGDAPQSQSNSTVYQSLPATAPKGQRVRDKASGEILMFNGRQWVKAGQ